MAHASNRNHSVATPELDLQDESRHSGGLANNKSSYRQKYKKAWELDTELRVWLTACNTDAYAAYCRYCRTKLHAHKKGLLAHAKSAKHKKHVLDQDGVDALTLMSTDAFNMTETRTNGDSANNDNNNNEDADANDSRTSKRKLRGKRSFNEKWLREPEFSQWLRKVPTNSSKALCIACRCVIIAGKCELIKHTKAAKHKRAIAERQFDEISDLDLQWLDASNQDQNFTFNSQNNSLIPSGNHRTSTLRSAHNDTAGMFVEEVIRRLEKHAPLYLAEKWDNVGIIAKPTQPSKVNNILLTIDLNERIVDEAIKKKAQFIISYHPPIFTPIKSLNPNSWKDKAILMCMENRITVYSPHTALDAIKGGINDWLISAFKVNEDDKIRPVYHSCLKKKTSCLEASIQESQETVAQFFEDFSEVTMTSYDNTSTEVRIVCDDSTLPKAIEKLAQINAEQSGSRITQLIAEPIAGVGMGRIIEPANTLLLHEVISKVKTHLNLPHVRLALSPKHKSDTKIRTLAVCAGSGSSVLKGCSADVWLTGEMSHHEVLDAINNGVSVILCEHSNTERGFLREWSNHLMTTVFENQLSVCLSELDRDPLRIV